MTNPILELREREEVKANVEKMKQGKHSILPDKIDKGIYQLVYAKQGSKPELYPYQFNKRGMLDMIKFYNETGYIYYVELNRHILVKPKFIRFLSTEEAYYSTEIEEEEEEGYFVFPKFVDNGHGDPTPGKRTPVKEVPTVKVPLWELVKKREELGLELQVSKEALDILVKNGISTDSNNSPLGAVSSLMDSIKERIQELEKIEIEVREDLLK